MMKPNEYRKKVVVLRCFLVPSIKNFKRMRADEIKWDHSFFPSTISDWNRLPPSVIDKITTESFKAGLCNV